jgi:hypothetical protein
VLIVCAHDRRQAYQVSRVMSILRAAARVIAIALGIDPSMQALSMDSPASLSRRKSGGCRRCQQRFKSVSEVETAAAMQSGFNWARLRGRDARVWLYGLMKKRGRLTYPSDIAEVNARVGDHEQAFG